MAEATGERLVNVIAPSSMEAGFQFQAELEGQQFMVTVPEGGVKEGETIQAPFNPNKASIPSAGPIVARDGNIPVGNWRNELCDCCDTCPCPFFMGWCLSGVVLGQVMQRMKLNFIGMMGNSENTCMIASIITAVTYILTTALASSSSAGAAIVFVGFLWFVVASTLTRYHMRQKYKIPADCCGESALSDCCCSYFCSCCVILQMHRHTHDENAYSYNITSKTGLDLQAPEIV